MSTVVLLRDGSDDPLKASLLNVVDSMPEEIILLFAIHKIQLYIGITETNSEEVLKQLQAGTLRSNTNEMEI